MIEQIIGWFCLVVGLINFGGGFVLFAQGKEDASRWTGIEAALYFIAAAICFK